MGETELAWLRSQDSLWSIDKSDLVDDKVLSSLVCLEQGAAPSTIEMLLVVCAKLLLDVLLAIFENSLAALFSRWRLALWGRNEIVVPVVEGLKFGNLRASSSGSQSDTPLGFGALALLPIFELALGHAASKCARSTAYDAAFELPFFRGRLQGSHLRRKSLEIKDVLLQRHWGHGHAVTSFLVATISRVRRHRIG